MHKVPAGIVLLGLGAFDTNILRLFLYRQAGWAIWTLNDFWNYYPDLVPDKAYQIHKDADEHVDEFGNQRNCTGFLQYCKKIGVDDIRYNLSPEAYSWYFGKQPKQWYQSTVNYMFVDAWRLIENGQCGPRIALEGMPFIGDAERDKQRAFIISAVEMSTLRGINTFAPHWDEWTKEAKQVDWNNLQDVETYGLTHRDAGLIATMVDSGVQKVKLEMDHSIPFHGPLNCKGSLKVEQPQISPSEALEEITNNPKE